MAKKTQWEQDSAPDLGCFTLAQECAKGTVTKKEGPDQLKRSGPGLNMDDSITRNRLLLRVYQLGYLPHGFSKPWA